MCRESSGSDRILKLQELVQIASRVDILDKLYTIVALVLGPRSRDDAGTASECLEEFGRSSRGLQSAHRGAAQPPALVLGSG